MDKINKIRPGWRITRLD